MKKVVTINLNGRAYQVEEEGYDALQTYLSKAEKTLSDNPDKAEILGDIEQAIADKCDAELTSSKNVVSNEDVQKALEKIGPVHETETAEAAEASDTESASTAETSRRLYRLPKDGKLAGVCAGLAAYFGTDATIVRLLFIVLTFVTQGFMILVYLVLIIAMPRADNPEEIAEAHGRPSTAEQIVGRIKEAATDKDTVQRIGDVITAVGKAIAKLLMFASATIFGAVTLIWVWLLSAIGLGGARLYDELASLNGFKQVVFVTAVYVVVALPFFIIVRILDRVGKDDVPSRGDGLVYGTLIALIVAGTVVISAFASVYTDTMGTYLKNHHGKLQVGSHSYCIDEARCGDGINYLRQYPQYWAENPQMPRSVLQN